MTETKPRSTAAARVACDDGAVVVELVVDECVSFLDDDVDCLTIMCGQKLFVGVCVRDQYVCFDCCVDYCFV